MADADNEYDIEVEDDDEPTQVMKRPVWDVPEEEDSGECLRFAWAPKADTLD